MARFLRNFFLFSLPPLLLFALPLSVFLLSGEAMPFRQVAWEQQIDGERVLFGRAYSDVDQKFKIVSDELRGADTVVLGSSRAMYVRQEFFRPGVRFYNVGGAARNPGGPLRFLDKISKEKQPKVIILGLDQRWFTPGFGVEPRAFNVDADPAWQQFFAYSWKKIFQDYVQDKFSLSQLLFRNDDEKRVGLIALARGGGFRNDGSYDSRAFIDDPDKQMKLKENIDAMVAAIIPGQYSIDYGDAINERSVWAIDDFLRESRERNIVVIGYLSPYAHAAFQKIQEIESPNKAAIKALNEKLEGVFAQHGFRFYDLSDISIFGGRDEEFISDAWHGGDKIFARAFLYLAKKDSDMVRLVATTTLENALLRPTNDHEVVPE